MLCNRFVNGKAGDASLAEGAIRRFPRIMIPSMFAALLYWAIFHWSYLDGRVCHQVGSVPQRKTVTFKQSLITAHFIAFDCHGCHELCLQVGESNGNFSVGFGDMMLNAVFSQYIWEESIFTILWTMRIEFLFSLLVYLFAFLYWRPIFERFRLAIHLIILAIIPIADASTSKVITSVPDPETGSTGPILVSSVPTLVWYLWPFMAGLYLADLHRAGYVDAITNCWVCQATGNRQASLAKRTGYGLRMFLACAS